MHTGARFMKTSENVPDCQICLIKSKCRCIYFILFLANVLSWLGSQWIQSVSWEY